MLPGVGRPGGARAQLLCGTVLALATAIRATPAVSSESAPLPAWRRTMRRGIGDTTRCAGRWRHSRWSPRAPGHQDDRGSNRVGPFSHEPHTSRRRRAGRLVIPYRAEPHDRVSLAVADLENVTPGHRLKLRRKMQEGRCNCIGGVVYRRTNGEHVSVNKTFKLSTTLCSGCW